MIPDRSVIKRTADLIRILKIRSRYEFCAGIGVKNVPAFRFPVILLVCHRIGFAWMNLYGKRFFRV